ncbi:cyclase family protein [Geomonas sp.]|uniref:cyclase family protein n=1 Tax=Geomonas sp. TaxID=2651584 RepID=UPI002B46D1C1|nr:cyclase family protein [Geomonas sp.]HJV33486.1 cyclase family protein [Geomonas sp.]
MRIHDITLPLSSELPVYPGDPPIDIAPWTSIADGDVANVSRITLCTHSGTHLDPPRHFDQEGLPVDQIPLDLLVGKAQVVEITNTFEIGRHELERLPVRGVERLLIKTGNSELWKESEFVENYATLTSEGASFLIEVGVRLVGIDYLSIESITGSGDVHHKLLEKGIIILEGLNLAEVAPGEYELICLPLKVKDGDGAPVRAILRGGPEHTTQTDFDPHSSKWPLS